MYRAGLSTNLDRGLVVLGKYAQHGAAWHLITLVDRIHPLAIVVDVLPLWVPLALWPPRCV